MKESSGKTKKQSKGVKRARSMRNVVMMVLICALMLSAATYAWFTLSTSAKVANLSMTVGEETSLLIAPDLTRGDRNGTPGTYGSALNFGEKVENSDSYDWYEIDCALLPATLESSISIRYPYYDTEDGTVITNFLDAKANTDILFDNTIANGEEKAGDYYCYRTTFYLKTAGSESVTVRLKAPTGDNMTTSTAPSEGGTYIINKESTGMGAAALRIRLTAENKDGETDEIVFEPLCDVILEQGKVYEYATLGTDVVQPTALVSTDQQNSNGSFAKNDGTLEISPDGTRVTMEVWVEGTDAQCVNQIMGNSIEGVLAFEVKGDTAD